MDAPRTWPGPAVELVELSGRARRLALIGPTGGRSPALPDVPGLLRPDSVEDHRAIWSVGDHLPLVALFGGPAPGAGIELFCLVAEILSSADLAGAGPHGGPDPWRILVRSDGQVAVLGHGLVRPEWVGGVSAAARAWAAPELPGEAPSAASDVWALAASAAALASGDVPASAVEPAGRTRGLGRALTALLHRCLDVRATARPSWSTALDVALGLLSGRRTADGTLSARFAEVAGPVRTGLTERLLARAGESGRTRVEGEDRHGLRARLGRAPDVREASPVEVSVVASPPPERPPVVEAPGDPPSSPGNLLLARLRSSSSPARFEFAGAALPVEAGAEEAMADFALRAAHALGLMGTDLDGRLRAGFRFVGKDGPASPSARARAAEGPWQLTAVAASWRRVDVRAGSHRAAFRLPQHVPVGMLLVELGETLGVGAGSLGLGGQRLPAGTLLDGLDLASGLDLLP